MEIQVKTEDGSGNVTFEGVLQKHEVDFVLNVGINFLLANGASPFIRDEDEDDAIVVDGPDTVQ